MEFSPFIPWYESIPVGTVPVSGGTVMALSQRYLYYSTPVFEPVLLIGFHASFQSASTRQITIQLCDSSVADVWTPFYQTPQFAIAGDTTASLADALPILPLPEPYLIRPGHRIQIVLRPNVTAVLNTPDRFTLAGVRDMRKEKCFN